MLPSQAVKHDMVQTGPFYLKCNGIKEQPKPVTLLCEPKLIVDVDPKAQKPMVIDKPGLQLVVACSLYVLIISFAMYLGKATQTNSFS